MSTVSVEAVGRAMAAILSREGVAIVYEDEAENGEAIPIDVACTASDAGLLPVLVAAGEAVWREMTGSGFALDMVRDPDALLGYRLRAIRDGTFTTVMLATMEATAQVARPGLLVLNDFHDLWASTMGRLAIAERAMIADTESDAL